MAFLTGGSFRSLQNLLILVLVLWVPVATKYLKPEKLPCYHSACISFLKLMLQIIINLVA